MFPLHDDTSPWQLLADYHSNIADVTKPVGIHIFTFFYHTIVLVTRFGHSWSGNNSDLNWRKSFYHFIMFHLDVTL